jgi:hypothetical protein
VTRRSDLTPATIYARDWLKVSERERLERGDPVCPARGWLAILRCKRPEGHPGPHCHSPGLHFNDAGNPVRFDSAEDYL